MRRKVPFLLLLGYSFAIAQLPNPMSVDKKPLATFEVATIKPSDPNAGGALGFYSRPGGRVLLGFAPVRMIVGYAFDIQNFQITGGPNWVGTDRYNIAAIPPETSVSRTAAQPPIAATPTAEQREMLQALLRDRFAFEYHWQMHDDDVYILSRGNKRLELKPPAHPQGDSRGTVVIKSGGIVDGQAFGENITMPFLAHQLSGLLKTPVLDQTGLTGHYDFDLPPSDPENRDITTAVFDAMDRLGLKLKRGKGKVDVLVIDHVERPTAD
ncbi:MAG TPA: TIGR03435 family protein [Chloroflexota bacterium]